MKKKYDILVHFGTCDFCGIRNERIVNYNYGQQEEYFLKKNNKVPIPFRLCGRCIGRGLVMFSYDLGLKKANELFPKFEVTDK